MMWKTMCKMWITICKTNYEKNYVNRGAGGVNLRLIKIIRNLGRFPVFRTLKRSLRNLYIGGYERKNGVSPSRLCRFSGKEFSSIQIVYLKEVDD